MGKRDSAPGDAPEPKKGPPISGPRKKERPSRMRQVVAANLVGQTKGKEGAERDAAVDAWVEMVIERQAKAAPEALREELRENMREMALNDPSLMAMVRALKA